MNLLSIRIITANVNRLVDFYGQITESTIIQYTPDFAELCTPTATLAIGSENTLKLFGCDTFASAASNKSAIIEFRVLDVQKEYERLKEYLEDKVVQTPTLMPWGNRSFLFHDPDGNLINFFTPETAQAIAKFDK